ncbi:Hypothetical protein, putative [Bodo saltans]|uniref:Uncharacterized protein n=1 Tax=Bodo saltans TaxID=75058 RepID=A0A0S4J8G4_BODSA|nr:Hypothetical protein, putative [Bodo saltans]|eukprot:CUG86508.1 Hypothetical protein, putative [Bodo saltans]
MISAQHTAHPPPPSLFSAFGAGRWTVEQWAIATKAAHAFPDPFKAELLEDCASKPAGRLFLMDYERCFNAVSARETNANNPLSERETTATSHNNFGARRHRSSPLTPEAYFVQCIKRNPSKAITRPMYIRGGYCDEAGEANFVASEATVKHFNERNAWSSDLWFTQGLSTLTTQDLWFRYPEVKWLHVLTGESGSGKTTWALTSCSVGIYLTPRDFDTSELHKINEHGYTNRNDALNMLKTALRNVMEGVLDFMVTPVGQSEMPVEVSIVLDDFVEHRRFVRFIAGDILVFRGDYSELFNFQVKLSFIVVGSIADAPSVRGGDFPPTLLRMPVFDSEYSVVKSALERRFGEKGRILIKALAAHSLARHLVCNLRFAALLSKRLVAVDDHADSLASEAAALAMLDKQLPLVALDWLAASPMCGEDGSAVAATCDLALALWLRDPLDKTALSPQEDSLVRSLGLLTDRGCNTNNPTQEDIHVGTGWSEEKFYAPAKGRYEMSMAQYLLCRMNYGLRELTDAPSWRRYEFIFAQYVADLIRGLNTRPLRALMLHLDMRRDDANGKALDATLSFKAVDIVDRRVGTTDIVDATSDIERALVIIEPAGSPFGGVVVILPAVAVISTCCDKNVGGRLEFSPESLRTLAKVPGGEWYYRVPVE